MASPPRVLTIAGSDCSGGAGIQADLKTFLSLKCYGLSVITAITAQNSRGVLKEDGGGVLITSTEFVEKQMRACWQDGRIDGVKIGMLGDENVVKEVASGLKRWREEVPDLPIILDPVMISTSGSLLLSPSSISSLLELLLPMCTVLTPNLPEAREILRASRELQSSTSQSQAEKKASSLLDGHQESSEAPSKHTFQTLLECAKQLCELGPQKVLLKGGHQPLSRQEVNQALKEFGINPHSILKEELMERDGCYSISGSTSRTRSEEFEVTLGFDRAEIWSNRASSSSTTSNTLQSASIITAIRTDSIPNAEILGGGPFGSEEPDASSSTDQLLVMDVLYESPHSQQSKGHYTLFLKPFIKSDCTHGTGCTLSSALASFVARANRSSQQVPTGAQHQSSTESKGEMEERTLVSRSTQLAISYVEASIVRGTPSLMKVGAGTLDHGCTLSPRGVLSRYDSIPRFSSADSLTTFILDSHSAPLSESLISHGLSNWRRYTQHSFTYQILNSSISQSNTTLSSSIIHFLIQDYHFLFSYSRLFSQISSISPSFKLVSYFSNLALITAQEVQMHIKLCESVGISQLEIENTRVSEATISYTRWAESIGREGGIVRSLVATLPCLLGYAEVGKRLLRLLKTKVERGRSGEINVMRDWIEEYGGEEFQEIAKKGIVLLEQLVSKDPPSPVERVELQRIWDAATRLEIGMWDEAMRLEKDAQSVRGILDPSRRSGLKI